MIWKTLLIFIFMTCPVFAGHVNGYYKSNGTYVQSYERSDPNGTVQDNYSYKGNTNPYTGTVGTNYYRNDPTSAYYQPSIAPAPQAFPSFDASQSTHTPQYDIQCGNNCLLAGYNISQCQQRCTN